MLYSDGQRISILQRVYLCNVVEDMVEILEHSASVDNNRNIEDKPTNDGYNHIDIVPKTTESKNWQQVANHCQVFTN